MRSDRPVDGGSSVSSDGRICALTVLDHADRRVRGRRSSSRAGRRGRRVRWIRPDGSSHRTAPLMAPRLAPMPPRSRRRVCSARLADEQPGPEPTGDRGQALGAEDARPALDESRSSASRIARCYARSELSVNTETSVIRRRSTAISRAASLRARRGSAGPRRRGCTRTRRPGPRTAPRADRRPRASSARG